MSNRQLTFKLLDWQDPSFFVELWP